MLLLAVIGVGIAKGHLTERGKKLLESAEVVYGSKKAIELVREYIRGEAVILKKFSEDVYREIEEAGKKKNVAVLSTGDPMVSGLGLKLKADVIESGISSVLVALSRIGVDLCDVVVVDCHARKYEECIKELKKVLNIRPAIVLVSRGFETEKLAEELDADVLILENLCSENERIRKGGVVETSDTVLYVKRGRPVK